MTNVLVEVGQVFRVAITEAFPGVDISQGIVQATAKFGDYQCTAPMAISQVRTILALDV